MNRPRPQTPAAFHPSHEREEGAEYLQTETNLLFDVLDALHRRRFTAMIVGAITTAAVFGILISSPKLYTSEAMLMVKPGRQTTVLDATANTAGSSVQLMESGESEINSIVEILQSREVRERLVATFKAEPFLKESRESPITKAKEYIGTFLPTPAPILEAELNKEAAVKYIRERLSVSAAKRSKTIAVRFQSYDPEFAQHVVTNAVAAAREIFVRANRTEGSQEFFDTQTEETRARVDEAQLVLRKLKDESGAADLEVRREIQLRRAGALEEQLLTAEAAIGKTSAEISARKQMISAEPDTLVTATTTGSPNSAADGMRQQLYALRLEEVELTAKYSENSPQVQRVREQVKQAEAALRKEMVDPQVTKGLNERQQKMLVEQLTHEIEAAGIKAKITVLQRQLESTHADISKLNEYEVSIASAKRTLALAEATLERYEESREQARIDGMIADKTICNINEYQPPSRSWSPTSPSKAQHGMMSLLFGSFGGIATALYRDWTRRRIA